MRGKGDKLTTFIAAPSADAEMPEGAAAEKDGKVYGGFTAKKRREELLKD
ncbi:MAG TPA: hypothetical protein VGJ20_26400 [Xanthobacteraceae bacterium]